MQYKLCYANVSKAASWLQLASHPGFTDWLNYQLRIILFVAASLQRCLVNSRVRERKKTLWLTKYSPEEHLDHCFPDTKAEKPEREACCGIFWPYLLTHIKTKNRKVKMIFKNHLITWRSLLGALTKSGVCFAGKLMTSKLEHQNSENKGALEDYFISFKCGKNNTGLRSVD